MKRFFLCMSLVACLGLGAGCDKKTEAPVSAPEADKPAEPAVDAAKADAAKAADAAKDDAAKDGEVKDAPEEPAAPSTPDGQGGQLVQSELYKVKFTVPADWKVSKGPTGVSVNSADDGVQMLVAGSQSQDVLEAVLRDLKTSVSFKDLKIEKQGATVVNGLAGIRGEGDATLVDGEKESPIHFVAFLAKVDELSVSMVIFSSQERYTKDLEIIEGVLNTLDKL